MKTLLLHFFSPPPMPEGLLFGGLSAIAKAFELAYQAGVRDGFFAGALLVLVLTSRRR